MGIDGSSRSSNASGDPQGKNRKPREMNGKVIALRIEHPTVLRALELTCWNGEIVRVKPP
jgi:hypothetical protein